MNLSWVEKAFSYKVETIWYYTFSACARYYSFLNLLVTSIPPNEDSHVNLADQVVVFVVVVFFFFVSDTFEQSLQHDRWAIWFEFLSVNGQWQMPQLSDGAGKDLYQSICSDLTQNIKQIVFSPTLTFSILHVYPLCHRLFCVHILHVILYIF